MYKNNGFTLIEIAIVLLIVTIILGYTVAMFPIQQELKRYRQAGQEMDQILDSLYAFAQVNGYLPCPAWTSDIADPAAANTSNGFECRDVNGVADVCRDGVVIPNPALDSCDVWFGYVPAKTLGLDGKYSTVNDLLLDPWGMPYFYQVSDNDDDGDGNPDFIIEDEMNDVGMDNLTPDLSICNTDPSPLVAGVEPTCAGAAQTVVNGLPVVILSMGKDNVGDIAATSWLQRENLDNSPTDRIFILDTFSDTTGAEYDDLIKWLTPNILYSRMIDGGQLQP